MPSRAVHDASPVATRMPAAMLFVPSVGGVSHSFDEHTHDKDLAVGARAFVGAAAGIVLQECAATPPERKEAPRRSTTTTTRRYRAPTARTRRSARRRGPCVTSASP